MGVLWQDKRALNIAPCCPSRCMPTSCNLPRLLPFWASAERGPAWVLRMEPTQYKQRDDAFKYVPILCRRHLKTSRTLFRKMFILLLLAIVLPSITLAARDTDIIIIGGGTAGCALAARLCAALPGKNIVILERGSPRSRQAEFLVRAARQTYASWRSPEIAEFIPVRPTRGLNGRLTPGLASATLGGSSSLNFMQWVVPQSGSVTSWGIRGLTSKTAAPFFRRAFRTVGFASQVKPLRQSNVNAILEAARLAGFARNKSPFNAEETVDYFENRIAVDLAGRRRDSCTSYLEPVRETVCASNLRVMLGTTVKRVLLSKGDNPRATGVVYSNSSNTSARNMRLHVRSGGEVIMSAGPFYSPKLLQLSGIGSPDVLKRAGIPLRVALPVGEGTLARPGAPISSLVGTPLEPSQNTSILRDQKQRRLWDTGRGGVLGRAPPYCNGRLGPDGYFATFGNFPDVPNLPVIVSFCFPNAISRGFMRVTSRNISDPMDVNMAMLDNRADLTQMTKCLERVMMMHKQLPKRLNATFRRPSNGRLTESWVRTHTVWLGEVVGGCPVGDVLTDSLHVRGVRGLRVVDASVFRNLPKSAGPLSSTYMLAEFMAKVIERAFKSTSSVS